MKKFLICLSFFACCFASANAAFAQNLKGLFDKEEPVFHVSVSPTKDSSTAMLTIYFTHSKAESVEGSLWVKDLGTNFATSGNSRMVKDLWELNNRKQDTIFIEGLSDLHFYTIGLDYRTPRAMSSRFTTKVLNDSYRYEFASSKAPTQIAAQTAKSAQPCQTPDISVRVEKEGYCGADNRPAVVIECMNCKDQSWTFRVEYSSNNESWQSLRSDGISQTAYGNSTRTEPLCALREGMYQFRISAKGEHCPAPVYHYIGAPVTISAQPAVVEVIEVPRPPVQTAVPLPDTCSAVAQANLLGNTIRGTVTLAANSTCAGMQPYAQIRYVHPGHRDLDLAQIPLIAGSASPFQFLLDQKDLKRSIHTIQVIIYVSPAAGVAAVPTNAFWIKAAEAMGAGTMTSNEIQAKGVVNTEHLPVTGGDKNYTRLQDLRPVYLSVQSDIPAFIAWANPAECVNGGCAYTVWAGKSNGPIRLLAKGKQGGSLVKESLQGLTIEERYIEVEVETKAGASIAAYVIGQGPRHDFGENYVHRERIAPATGQPESAPQNLLVAQPTPTPVEQLAAKGAAQIEEPVALGASPKTKPAPGTMVLEQPQLPIETFKNCKYQREISVVGDMPITAGDWLAIKYNFSEQGYKYTLYFQPEGQQEWFIAPGTKELQDKPEFYLEMTKYHSGRYAVLAYSFQNRWGCLSAPLEESLRIKVENN